MENIAQDLVDQQWLNDNLKDSTNNPCVGDALSGLGAISDKLPKMVRDFFYSGAGFSMTLKMADLGPNKGAGTQANVFTPAFLVNINSHFEDATDLALAATIIHEAFHCQLMSWFREAVRNNDQAKKEELAAGYGYTFSNDIISMDSSLAVIVNGGNPTQHQDMINRYQGVIAAALLQFAQSRGMGIDLAYCTDLAWTGTFDSKAFNDLSWNTQQRILERVNAEKDPFGNQGINTTSASPKGKPCP